MPRSPLTETITRVEGMIEYVASNLSPEEFDLFLDKVAPLPEPEQGEAKPKRGRKKAAKSASKRSSGMAAALNRSLAQRDQSTSVEECCFRYQDTAICGEVASNPIHDPKGGYAGYHEFQEDYAEGTGQRSGQ